MASRKRRNTRPTKLRATIARAFPETVPTRWVKSVIAVFLLPLAWVLSQTFFSAFTAVTVHADFWATMEFWFFSLGVLIWMVPFFMLPRPVTYYVFGHELTHAIWVWLMGGRVSEFKVSADGGHILANKINTWIALAPYFFPIYSLLVIVIYGIAGIFWDMTPFQPVLFMLIGATWAFHITFTVWMIPRGQSDLAYGGMLFSLVVIYILNVTLLSVFLIIASASISWSGFVKDLMLNGWEFMEFLSYLVRLTKV